MNPFHPQRIYIGPFNRGGVSTGEGRVITGRVELVWGGWSQHREGGVSTRRVELAPEGGVSMGGWS